MPPPDLAGVATLDQPLGRVLPDRLQQAVARVAVGPAGHQHQRLVHQPRQQIERPELVGAICEDPRRDLERPAADEHRQHAQQPLLLGGELVVAPLDRRLQRLLPRQRGLAAGQQPEAIVQLAANLLDREQLHAGGRELQRQRDAVEPAADVGDRLGVVVGQREVRRDRCARSMNSCTAWEAATACVSRASGGGAASERTANSRSPSTPRPSRLVARTRRLAAGLEEVVDEAATAASRCSQLSRTSSSRRPAT